MTIFADKYWERRIGGTSYPYLVPGIGQIPMGDNPWLIDPTDHLLRTYYNPLLRVHVGTTGAPNPLWWAACTVVALAWWADATDTTFYTTDSDYEGLLIVDRLHPVMTVDQAAVGGYTVTWAAPQGPLSCATRRKPGGAITDPVVRFALELVDPGIGIVGHLNSGTHVYATDTEETLWGTV